MAWTITRRFLVPANWDESSDTSRTRFLHVTIMGKSDGAAELSSDVILDLSNLLNDEGEQADRLAIESLCWDVTGLTSLELSFNRSPSEPIAVLSDTGSSDFNKAPLSDTGEGGDGSGDIIATTVGAAADAVFQVTVKARVKGLKAAA